MIAVSHHVTFFLGKRFPNAVPLIYVLGYPKSGTSWACQLISDYLRLPFPQHTIFPVGCPAVVHGHDLPSLKFPRGVFVIRDGRDVMVSSFHHLKSQFENGGGKKKQRAFFRSVDADAPVREALPAFIKHCARHPFAAKGNWGEHFHAFQKTKGNLAMVRYEDLLEDTEQALTTLIDSLTTEPVNLERIKETVARYSFAAQSGRDKGKEQSGSYLRKGESGDWRNHFSRAAAEMFDSHFGTALIEAGYEPDNSWVGSISK